MSQRRIRSIAIVSYEAKYRTGSLRTTEGILHRVKYRNSDAKNEIVAVQIGFVSLDVWNELLDRTAGLSMGRIGPGEKRESTWVTQTPVDFSFLTGFAYPERARFSDGTLWAVDPEKIAEEIRKIDRHFDANELRSDP